MAAARNVSAAASMTLEPCALELMGDLADGRGLAGAVHPDHQHDMGSRGLVRHERLRHRLEHARDLRGEHGAHGVRSKPHARSGLWRRFADASRHGDAEIGLDQHLFELVERLLVELPLGERAGEIVGQRRGAARESLAKLGEPAPLRRLGDVISLCRQHVPEDACAAAPSFQAPWPAAPWRES